jgi:Fe-S-cluster-containing hydrogenase component 2
MGLFIQISLDSTAIPPDLAMQLVQACPVNIFEAEQGHLIVSATEEDECTLCGLCLALAPQGAVKIYKTYSSQTLVSGSHS